MVRRAAQGGRQRVGLEQAACSAFFRVLALHSPGLPGSAGQHVWLVRRGSVGRWRRGGWLPWLGPTGWGIRAAGADGASAGGEDEGTL